MRPIRVIARRRLVLGILACCLALPVAGCDESQPVRISGPAQGTTYQVTVMGSHRMDAQDVRTAMTDVIETIDQQMSTWRDVSEIAKFNAAPANTWVPVSRQLAKLSQTALEIGRDTDGAFDVTLGPILAIWGFGAGASAPTRLPNRAELDEAREKTGIGLIEVRMTPPALRKKRGGTTLDLAGLAQGYTVDRMAHRLDHMGATDYLVELGGELYASGTKDGGDPWRIGVERPTAGERAIERVVGLEDAGMTTSGDYRNFFEIDGRRFSHTIDPRTGRPVAHDLRAVTVIANKAMTADAMATALLVMGSGPGLRYANEHDIAALFVSGSEGEYAQQYSNAFEPYLEEPQ